VADEAHEAAEGAGSEHWQAAETASCECCINLRTKDGGLLCTPDSRYVDFMAAHDPAVVLRRCEADRRILARHREWAQSSYCEACDQDLTTNVNDCPELLDLAHAHGLTDEILAGLDRPQSPEQPNREPHPEGPMGMLSDAFERALTPPITTSDVPEALRGHRWKP
jgi:hypothetical protein